MTDIKFDDRGLVPAIVNGVFVMALTYLFAIRKGLPTEAWVGWAGLWKAGREAIHASLQTTARSPDSAYLGRRHSGHAPVPGKPSRAHRAGFRWLGAYQFPSIRHRLRKTRTPLAAVLAEWAKSYLRCAQSSERRARDELFDFRGRRVPKAPTE